MLRNVLSEVLEIGRSVFFEWPPMSESVRAWNSLPPALQKVLARNFDAAAVKEREDLAKLNQNVESELKKLRLTFNRTDPAMLRAALSKAGYYKQWREKIGNEAWALLEKYSGPLA
jgi:TRAP-type C4-dicarboxylate transport system substrate-binding protein